MSTIFITSKQARGLHTGNLKKVALTFDDGPNLPYTNEILDILKKEKVRATFFVCGANVKRHSEIVKRAAKEGHLVGNHSFNHRRLPTLLGTIYEEIVETQKLIEDLTGQKQKLFRPPWGYMPFWLEGKLAKEGFAIDPYDDSGHDWEQKITAAQIAKNVIDNARDGQIILLHDGRNTIQNADRAKTVQALPQIIAELKKQNYEFVPYVTTIG